MGDFADMAFEAAWEYEYGEHGSCCPEPQKQGEPDPNQQWVAFPGARYVSFKKWIKIEDLKILEKTEKACKIQRDGWPPVWCPKSLMRKGLGWYWFAEFWLQQNNRKI